MEETAQRMPVEEKERSSRDFEVQRGAMPRDPNARAQEDSDKVGPRGQLSRRRKTEKEKLVACPYLLQWVEKGRTSRFDFVALKPSCHHKFTFVIL